MDDQEPKGARTDIPAKVMKEALDSVDGNGESAEVGADQEVRIEIEGSPKDAPVPAPVSEGPSREELLDMINKLREEAKAARDRMLRIAADADNTRKRALKDKEEGIRYGHEALLRDILVPLDNLERTLEHVPDGSENEVVRSLHEGLTMVVRQFTDTLASHYLVGFSAVGTAFNPNLHEALHRTETTEAEPGTVISELQRGYMLRDRLLRPALVNVACLPESQEQAGEACAEPCGEDCDQPTETPADDPGTEEEPTS